MGAVGADMMDETVRRVLGSLGHLPDINRWEDRGDRLWRARDGERWYYVLFSANLSDWKLTSAAVEFVDDFPGVEDLIRELVAAEIERATAEFTEA